MKSAIVTVGCPGSGKSTWMKNLIRANRGMSFIHTNRDEIRDMITGGLYSENRYTFDKEGYVTSVQNRTYTHFLYNRDIEWYLNSDTNLNLKILRTFVENCLENKLSVYFKTFFDVDLETLLGRNIARESIGERFVPKDVIHTMFQKTAAVSDFIAKITEEHDSCRIIKSTTLRPESMTPV